MSKTDTMTFAERIGKRRELHAQGRPTISPQCLRGDHAHCATPDACCCIHHEAPQTSAGENTAPYLAALAFEIADEDSACLLECNLLAARDVRGAWCDLRSADELCQDAIARAVTYLTLRGRLRHHPTRPELVAVSAGRTQ